MKNYKPFETDISKGDNIYDAYSGYHAELLIEWDKKSMIQKEVENEVNKMITQYIQDNKDNKDVDLENKGKIT